MERFRACLLSLLALASTVNAQAGLVPANGGDGSDGAFAPPPGVLVLDTSVKQVWQFTTLTVSSSATINVVGPWPLLIKVQGAAQIDGMINASGAAGASSNSNLPGGAGGTGGPGGGAGGNGGAFPTNPFNGSGQPGTGPSPGQPGFDSGTIGGAFGEPVGGGGGGGNATAGAMGGPANSGATTPASGAGGPAVLIPRGGSGGGGGGADIDSATVGGSNDGGGGGGGGGGDIMILSNGSITINGSLLANGGAGGTNPGNGGAGGGGSGGAIEFHAPTVVINGVVHALGGAGGLALQGGCGCSPGGMGGDGRIVIGAVNISGALAPVPPPTTLPLGLVLTPWAPASGLNITAQAPTSNYIVAMATSLAPVPIVLPAGTFFLDLADPLLNLLFPVNNLPSVFGNLTGTGSGYVGVNVFPLGIPFTFDVSIFSQGASLTPAMAIDGVTQLVPVRIRF